MNEAYKRELRDLKQMMEKAESFAQRLPVFRDVILGGKMGGDENMLPFPSGIYPYSPEDYITEEVAVNRRLFTKERGIPNYGKGYTGYLCAIRVDPRVLYKSDNDYGLGEIADQSPVVFYDEGSYTFYASDYQIEGLLVYLHSWYDKAKISHKQDACKKELMELKARVKLLEEAL